MRVLYSYGAALIIVLVLGAWMATGTLVRGGQGPGKGEKAIVSFVEPKGGPLTAALDKTPLAKKSELEPGEPNPNLTIAQREAATTGAAAPVRAVEVRTFTAQAMPITVPLNGQTEPKATVTASAETTGIVATVNVQKGQTVKTGDLLCTLDPETRQAAVAQAQGSLAQANASLAQAQADYQTNQTLIAKGAASPNSARQLEVAVQAAKASVAAAQAGLDNAKAELGRTKIYAKTDGVVEEPIANVGSMLSAAAPGGATCATIVQLDPIVFSGMVPEAHINLARIGLPATITTVTGQKAEGKVSFISAVADSATRTFEINIDLPNPGNRIPSGLSATAMVNVGTAPAQLLPQSVLTLDDNGTMGVRAVDANGKVVFYPVTIVKDAREGMYVTGLPAKLDVITTGQEFVKAGDKVKAVQAKDNNGAPIPATTSSNGAVS